MPRFVWLHGFGSSPTSTKATYVAARLAERGLALETPDFNEPSFRELTVSRMLRQLDALADLWRLIEAHLFQPSPRPTP